ncbi:PolC-type DNA polymerase III [Anaerorhabdus sp.]|uniref:PolC-type DNA polymerase III n=1 Tax=Anaerorhabdus sp. TaxID=1872524 RepID=UPI002FCA04B4
MKQIQLCDLIHNIDINPKLKSYFDEATVLSAKFYRKTEHLYITIQLGHILPFDLYRALNQYFCASMCKHCTIHVDVTTYEQNIQELQKYVWHFSTFQTSFNIFKEGMPSYTDDGIKILFATQEDVEKAMQFETNLVNFLNTVGFKEEMITLASKELDAKVDDVVVPLSNASPTMDMQKRNDQPKYSTKRVKKENYITIKLKDAVNECDNIQFDATVFKVVYQTTRTGNTIQTIYLSDETDAIVIKRFENNRLPLEKMKEINEWDTVRVHGSIIYDSYEKELVCKSNDIEKIEKESRKDTSTEKRVELHTHTIMSEMDGVCEIAEYVNQAYKWGHSAIAITDHMAVQAFPKAQAAVSKILKKNPDAKFKMIYGVEMNLVEPELKIVKNPKDIDLLQSEYICFDLETTGLSSFFDHVIEFGGVLIKNQTVVEHKQLFIKPPVSIPPFIQEKTSITDEMVSGAKTFEEAIDEILDWIQDRVLVAHNATFDIGFMNEELKRIGRKPLTNPVIDTLDFARAILSERRTYRLGNIARAYRISYDEEVAHRADYDANVLADVFLAMMHQAKELGATTVAGLQELQSPQSFAKVRNSHVVVLAKNQAGIKSIYQLVTISNTETIAVFGNANSKANGSEFLAEPRIFKKILNEKRENILIGSACLNGEVFECASNKGQDDLEKAMSFYDYIEIQPLANYSHLLAMHSVPNMDRLKAILKRIIDTAKQLRKLVVVSGDVHYCEPDEKIYRDIYIQTQGIGGVRHPLFIYNEKIRRNTINPEQHFRTTNEMIESFEWLDNPSLVHEIVIENTNKIADMIEKTQPVPSGLFTPTIEGSDDKLREICFDTAHKMYGEVLPEIVEKRLERELNSIIGNGYGVIYYISHLLVKRSNEDGYLVGSRGSVGSSFVATMSGITEVNPLAPHYVCSKCQYSEFIEDDSVASGFDLPDKPCPHCGEIMRGNGQNIPFETFLGFEGDKVPDIDLNFSGEYQEKAHLFTKEVFGEDHVFRAGTIGTVADKTAFGYVTGYSEEMGIENMRKVQKERLAIGCTGVKRTTGQHPGGIIVIPHDMEVTDFSPVQFPANDPNSTWKTTHFDFHDIHDNVLKFDILGHVDPTAMRLLQNISGIDPRTIPMNDPETMSLFSSADALKADIREFGEKTGAMGLPEFGTTFVRGMLEATKPKNFSDLIIISGLSHGTDVWLNNAADLVESGITLQEVIGCRDDIMTYLLHKKLEPKVAFTIMESVRKGKGLTDEWVKTMEEHDVPQWYIDSCKKIKYMFPKAHAVAYVIMAVRIAWFKVHYPHWYYISYFSLRCDAYEIETMTKGIAAIKSRLEEIRNRRNDYETAKLVTKKENDIYNILEVCLELYARGYKIGKIDLYKSLATEFTVEPGDVKTILPPFTTIDGLGENVAKSIVVAREKGEFISKEDLVSRTQLSTTLLRKLEVLGAIDGLQDKNQMSLF